MNDIFENWTEIKSALLEGLDPQKSKIVAPLLENQKKQILLETAASGQTDASSIAGFRKILLPMIRRVIPSTIATEIVGVQPMRGPVDLVYTLRYKYAESITTDASAGPIDNGVGNIDISIDPEAFGNYNFIRRFYSGATDAAQAAGASGIMGPGNISGTAQGHAWPSALDAASVGPAGAAGSLHGGAGSWLEASGGRKMSLEVISQAVEAGSRKLQASWTIEAMQDLQSQHNLDLENEMTQALSAEIVQEIDNEIITDLLSLAGTVANFDGSVPAGPGYYRPTFVGDRLANLGVLINYVANEIARKTRRGAGNFIVVSPMLVSVLQSAAKSVFAPAVAGSFKGPNNTQLAGTLNGTIKVYSYLWNNVQSTDVGGTGNDSILIGYKGGNGETDTGYFYTPYVPLMSSGVVMNPVTFTPVVSLMTRYGKATFTSKTTSLGNSADYYGKVNVTAMSLS